MAGSPRLRHPRCVRIPPMSDPVTYTLDEGIATIALDDGKVNVQSIATLNELHAAFDQAERDGAVVMLTGREGCFSAGFDLKVFRDEPERLGEMLTLGATLYERMLAFPTPVLAPAPATRSPPAPSCCSRPTCGSPPTARSRSG